MDNKVIIVTAPSGSGKTTLVKYLLERFATLEFSVSACTREPRHNELHGRDYYFISPDEFQKRIADKEFVEYEEVYPGNYYGTLNSEINRIWASRGVVLFDVDVKGALKLKEIFKDDALAVFIKAPNLDILEARLRSRGTESEDKIQVRLSKVREELMMEPKFDVVVVNDRLDKAQNEIEQVVAEFIR